MRWLFEGSEMDQYGHRKLGGIGDLVSKLLKEVSPRYNKGGWSTSSINV